MSDTKYFKVLVEIWQLLRTVWYIQLININIVIKITTLEKKIYLLQLGLVRQTQYSNFQTFQSDTCTFRPSHMIPIENQTQTSHYPDHQFLCFFGMLHLAFDQTPRWCRCSKHEQFRMSLFCYRKLDKHQSSDTKACRYCMSQNAVIAIWRWFLSCRKWKKLEKKRLGNFTKPKYWYVLSIQSLKFIPFVDYQHSFL